MQGHQQLQPSNSTRPSAGRVAVILTLALVSGAMVTEASDRPPGLSFAKSGLDRIDMVVLPEIDIRPLLAEDQIRDARLDQGAAHQLEHGRSLLDLLRLTHRPADR